MGCRRIAGTLAYTAMLVTLVGGCGDRKPIGATGTGGVGGSGVPDGGPGGGSLGGQGGIAGGSAVGGGAGQGQACTSFSSGVIAPRRIVRMTHRQIANSIGVMFGDAQMKAIETKYSNELLDPSIVSFLPLNGNREGTVIIPARWTVVDDIAQVLGKHVFDNFATVTGCATAADDCAKKYLAGLAESAYRRPLDQVERDELDQEYADLKAVGSTIEEATRYSVYAILSAPAFLYRSELGQPAQAAGEYGLTGDERATQLSFFLGDFPPDATLRAAGRTGGLVLPDGVSGQVNRLLAMPAVQANLSAAISTYFKLNSLKHAADDPTLFPELTAGLRAAMATEAEMFLDETLWRGKLAGLLTSRATFVNSDLATVIYGIPVPPGATTATFVPAQLPDVRAGLLTQAAFLVVSSYRTNGTILSRGLSVEQEFTCLPLPSDLQAWIDAIMRQQAGLAAVAGKGEAANSAFRMSTPDCATCHVHYEPYGIVLHRFDGIGRHRMVDERGAAVVPSTTLPPGVGGGQVGDAVEMADRIARSAVFPRCMAKSMLQYALSDIGTAYVALDSCAVREATEKLNAISDPTFADLLRAVAASRAVFTRKVN